MITPNAEIYKDIISVLYTREEIEAAVRSLGETLTRDYQGKTPIMICILKGAAVFYCDLIRCIDLNVRTDFMVLSSYGSKTSSSGRVRIVQDLDRDIRGEDVIIVEDIIDSGKTLATLQATLQVRQPESIRIATLLDKPERRRVPLQVDYACLSCPDAFVVGYGLDFAEKYRNLPDIGVLHPSVYE